MPKFSYVDKNNNWNDFISKLEVGDFIFTYNYNSLISKLIASFDKGSWSHVGQYVGNGMVCEAITPRVTKRKIEVYKDNSYIGIYRIANLTDEQKEEMVNFCLSTLGDKYNYIGVLKLVIKHILKIPHNVPTPNGLIYRMDKFKFVDIYGENKKEKNKWNS